MPDHLHVILFGQTDEARPKAAIEGFKKSSAIWLARHCPDVRWQEGFHDRIIRDHKEWQNKIRYILNNPVRAGLVSTFEDYPHLGSQAFTMDQLLGGWE
jgi:REP element-mobilizing transposase RayT